jgi:catechol 2,3-dioxygenase-like lactoylglutathione lyase family enzyme
MHNPPTENQQFLELSLAVADVRKSLEWYRELGFVNLPVNEVRDYYYAVVGDGDFCIGLHDSEQQASGLTFVRPNLAAHVLNRMDAGEEFDHAVLGIDDFHEAVQSDPDGTLATLLEARTFSPGHERADGLAGRLHSLVIPCMRVDESLAFWQRYGFMAVESADSEHAELHMPGLIIELHAGSRGITLRFQPDDYDASVATLNSTHQLKMFSEPGLKGVELVAPEGTRLQLLQ